MDDQDLINLQKLAGRASQPSLLDPPTPEHELLARALWDHSGPFPLPPKPGPYQLALADALENFGKQGAPPSGYGAHPTSLSNPVYSPGTLGDQLGAPDQQLASYSYPVSQGDSLVSGRRAPEAETRLAMGSPANVDLPWQTMADQYTPPQPRPTPRAAPPPPAPPSNLQTTIDPIPGYDETGDNTWRASNDKVFLDAVNRYNTANGYRPGDDGYWTADMLKAQAMVESGHDRNAFSTDPLQVNRNGVYVPEKKTILGLDKGQAMTPASSSEAALKWLQYKAWPQDGHKRKLPYIGDEGALWRYSGDTNLRSHYTKNPDDDGLTQQDWYASTIPRLAEEAATSRAAGAAGR